jgi:hypothetical protein
MRQGSAVAGLLKTELVAKLVAAGVEIGQPPVDSPPHGSSVYAIGAELVEADQDTVNIIVQQLVGAIKASHTKIYDLKEVVTYDQLNASHRVAFTYCV